MERKIAEQSSLVVSAGNVQGYFKAVRPDGTDFRTGTVDYAAHLGKWLPELSHVDNPKCCSGDVYHVSTSAADTLIGGSWPCRLFEVEAEAVAEEKNKRGVYTMRVIRELPAWQALGPNGEAVVALIEKAKTLTAGQIESLYAAWDAAKYEAWDAAKYEAWDAAKYEAWDAAWDAARDAAKYAAKHAAWYAASALVVKDLISEEHFNILYSPWASVMDNQV